MAQGRARAPRLRGDAARSVPATPVAAAPAAPRGDHVDVLHGRPVPDPYRGLEDPRSAPTRAWLAGEDRLARGVLDALPGRLAVARELARHLAAGSTEVPVRAGGRTFTRRRPDEAAHPVLEVRDPDGTRRVLLDPAELDPTGATTLDGWHPGPAGRLVAVALSSPAHASRLRVVDADDGATVEGPFPRTAHSPVAWLPGDEEFFWVRGDAPGGTARDGALRRVLRHRVGTDPDTDVELPGVDIRPGRYFGVRASRDGRWLVVDAADGTAPGDGLWVADLGHDVSGAASLTPSERKAARSPAVQILRPEDGVRAHARVEDDGRLWLVTTLDAPRGRLCVTDPADPAASAGWTELVGEDPDTVLTAARLMSGVAVLARTRDGVSELHRHEPCTGRALGRIDLPGGGAVTELATGHGDDPRALAVGWTSVTDPPRVLRADVRTGAVHDPDRLAATVDGSDRPRGHSLPPPVRRLRVTGVDGHVVTVLVLAPSTSTPDEHGASPRPRPTLLTGYGGFGRVVEPEHSPTALAWVAAGGVWAQAILRGGGEEGEQSHRAGRRAHHLAGTADLHAVADALVAAGWTARDRLALIGGSHGGLRVAEAVAERPGAYAGAVCASPVADLVRSERSGLGAAWRDEYGSAEHPDELEWLLAASPYHRVRPGTPYPPVLVTASEADTRVDARHARKLVAALAHATTGPPGSVLLRRETDTGHGARSVPRALALATDHVAFLAAATGLDLTALEPGALEPGALEPGAPPPAPAGASVPSPPTVPSRGPALPAPAGPTRSPTENHGDRRP